MIPKKMGKFQLKMKMWSKLNGNVCPKMIPFFPSNGKGDGGHCVCNNLCFFHQTDASWVALKLNGRMGLSATPAAVSPNHSAVWGGRSLFQWEMFESSNLCDRTGAEANGLLFYS